MDDPGRVQGARSRTRGHRTGAPDPAHRGVALIQRPRTARSGTSAPQVAEELIETLSILLGAQSISVPSTLFGGSRKGIVFDDREAPSVRKRFTMLRERN